MSGKAPWRNATRVKECNEATAVLNASHRRRREKGVLADSGRLRGGEGLESTMDDYDIEEWSI